MKVRVRVLAATVAATVGMLGVLAIGSIASASPPSGFTPTILVKADLNETVRSDSDKVRFRTKDPTDVMVQKIVQTPGGSSGWHHHPGIVIVAVESGSVTVWDSDCNKTTYGPGLPDGSVFTESGDEPGQVTSSGGATLYATFVAPSADPAVFRIEDDPPPCA
jgi:quercetin dioxygenase-like cupin family protein